MLNRAEDTGGTRTLKLAKGPGSGQNKTSPKPLSQGSNDASDGSVPSRGEKKSAQHGAELLSQVAIVELLLEDERPTFIVDLRDDENTSSNRLHLLYSNLALIEQSSLLESVEGKSDDLTLIFETSTPHRDFKLWVLKSPNTPGTSQTSAAPFVFAGYTWRASTVRKCLRIVHGNMVTTAAIANERNSGPNLQQLLGPGSSSPGSRRDLRPESASYFDSGVIQGGRLGTPGKMSVLYEDFSNDRSSESSREEPLMPQHGGSPTANGGIGISDLLMSETDSTSSMSSQKAVFPVRLSGEEFGTITTMGPSEPGFFDWTRLPVTSALPWHIQFARGIDWGATSLGRSTQLIG